MGKGDVKKQRRLTTAFSLILEVFESHGHKETGAFLSNILEEINLTKQDGEGKGGSSSSSREGKWSL